MKVTLIYPKYPDTFWSFKYALQFISKKATHPPLGLLTIAAMLPKEWDKKVFDMNVVKPMDQDIERADLVFISAMVTQKVSAKEVIARCKRMGVKVVAGGPLFTAGYLEFEEVDHLILNEAEITLPLFLKDLEGGNAKHIYSSPVFADIEKSPIPQWELLNIHKYVSMSIQYSRGCPFNCDFCDITNLFGRKVRAKNKEQVLRELENLYAQGWRSNVFFVDDNFIGNKKKLKSEILPAIIHWNQLKQHPFTFNTQASINLSDDDELLQLMVKAGFDSVFVGIETPHTESLIECNKVQNRNRDMIANVRKIEAHGLRVTGGFIVGFDSDPTTIFERMIEFIQKSGIVSAMVGLLNAPHGTRLSRRLEKENRLLKNFSGDNTDFSMNFIPKMKYGVLVDGYKKIINGIYAPKPYHQRIKRFLMDYKSHRNWKFHFWPPRFRFNNLLAFLKSVWILGINDKARVHYWELFLWALFKRPRLFPLAITFAIYGYHFRKIFRRQV